MISYNTQYIAAIWTTYPQMSTKSWLTVAYALATIAWAANMVEIAIGLWILRKYGSGLRHSLESRNGENDSMGMSSVEVERSPHQQEESQRG